MSLSSSFLIPFISFTFFLSYQAFIKKYLKLLYETMYFKLSIDNTTQYAANRNEIIESDLYKNNENK